MAFTVPRLVSKDVAEPGVIAMPVAAFGVMFCMRYNRDERLMTEITFMTTVLSVVTIPLLHVFIQWVQSA